MSGTWAVRSTGDGDLARDQHHRFPGQGIRPSVWLYDRFCPSSGHVKERLVVGGITVPSEIS